MSYFVFGDFNFRLDSKSVVEVGPRPLPVWSPRVFSGSRKAVETCCPLRASSVSLFPLVMFTAKTPNKEMSCYQKRGPFLASGGWGSLRLPQSPPALLCTKTCSVLTTEVVNY